MYKFIAAALLSFLCLTAFAEIKIYKGNSTYSGDCVATFRDRKLYKGNSTYSGDCIFTFSETPSPRILAAVMYFFYRGLFL